MPRIAVTADTHLGITSPQAVREMVANVADCDLFVHAGDIGAGQVGPRSDGSLHIFEDVRARFRALVLGNHDLWLPDECTCRESFDIHWPAACRNAGWIWLEQDNVVLEDVAVVGTIAWYDYSHPSVAAKDPIWVAKIKKAFNNDGNFMDPDWDDRSFATERAKELAFRLDACEKEPSISRVVVITHVPLFLLQHVPRQGDSPIGNAYFYNLTLGRLVAEHPKVSHVVSGHTHRGVQGFVEREGMQPINVVTVGSDYGAPAFEVFEL